MHCFAGDDKAKDDSDEDENRDRGKARKYKKLADAKAIPQHIVQMIEEDSKNQPKPRQYKTNLINKLFIKTEKGDYQMKPNQPVFESFKESVHKQYGRDETEGSPKTVFLWKVFQGKEDVLNAAIAEGSVTEWQQDGITFCAFRKMNAGVEKNWSQTTQLKAGPQKLQDDQFQNLSKAFSSLCWQFGQWRVDKLPVLESSIRPWNVLA